MGEIRLSELVNALPSSDYAPASASDLSVCDPQRPFVAPRMQVSEAVKNPLSAEVIYVKAPAAVGKTTLARHLSSAAGVPFLDLSEVPAATGTLKALISDLRGSGDPTSAFHKGELPIIVDALDEGRLLSGENSFESFLDTTGELLSSDRSVLDRPKLIIFGRPESVEITRIAFQISSEATERLVEVEFFDEAEARTLVHAYAEHVADPDSAYLKHYEPADTVVENYFTAIEKALGLNEGTLWREERGRAFAGYAPVLAALGSLIAKMDNFQDVANRIRDSATREAWDVIETVIDQILEREKDQLQDKLADNIPADVPDEAYDREEQLTLLTQYVHGEKLQVSGRVDLTGSDLTEYVSMAERRIEEHPFVQQQSLTNVVLGSVVLSHAVANDQLGPENLDLLGQYSRQPFVWRSLHRRLDEEELFDGLYLGYLLRSFWNDPITKSDRCTIRTGAMEGAATVELASYDGSEVSLLFATPIRFFAEAKECDVKLEGELSLVGAAPQRSQKVFFIRDKCSFICDTVDVLADAVTVDGEVWLEADEIVTRRDIQLTLKNDAEVGWAGAFAATHPWSQYPSTVTAPEAQETESRLDQLLQDCRDRLPAGVLILQSDLLPVEDEARNSWVRREYEREFPALIRLMKEHGLATVEGTETEGTIKKVHVRFATTWEQVYRGTQNPSDVAEQVRDFLSEARDRLS